MDSPLTLTLNRLRERRAPAIVLEPSVKPPTSGAGWGSGEALTCGNLVYPYCYLLTVIVGVCGSGGMDVMCDESVTTKDSPKARPSKSLLATLPTCLHRTLEIPPSACLSSDANVPSSSPVASQWLERYDTDRISSPHRETHTEHCRGARSARSILSG